VRIQKTIFEEAAGMDASDIHIEPGSGATRVRYRVNGILRDSMEVPKWMHENLVVRIKVLAKLDISERRLPQDGHIAAEESNGMDVRVSVLPTRWEEKIVIRILRRGRQLMTLAQLGIQPEAEERLHALIRRPQGMLLVVGPTGSGKTTSLYAFVNEIRQEPMTIVTIEDPVEYEVDGISQVPVNDKTALHSRRPSVRFSGRIPTSFLSVKSGIRIRLSPPPRGDDRAPGHVDTSLHGRDLRVIAAL
jgi:type IV pilus assembly protein PilB